LQRQLIAAPAAAVAFLQERLRSPPLTAADLEQMAQWLTDLDSDQFDVRDGAYRGLAKWGVLAEPMLRTALQGNIGLETRRRINQLLAQIERGILTPDEPRAARAVEVLERIASAEARKLLETLARGTPGAVLTRAAGAALARLRR
jgi:hypothetical protein